MITLTAIGHKQRRNRNYRRVWPVAPTSGIGTTVPPAQLSVGSTSATAVSQVLSTYTANALGTSAGSNITLASFGGNTAGNATSLGIKLGRVSNGSGWTTSALGFTMDVDSSPNAGGTGMWLTAGGKVGIGTTSPTQRLQVGTSGDGTVALANAWNTFSDIRLKRDLAVIPDALDKLLELHGYYYFWKDGSDQTRQVGVVAQEVEKILPELVRTGSDGIKTVDYPKLTAVLIEGTKQLKAEKDSEIAQLKARADAAEAEAEAALLKRALCDKFPDLAVCSH